MTRIFLLFLFVFRIEGAQAQAASYSDPAAAFLRLLIEKNDAGSYQLIGNFKVIGSSYLYGEKITGNVYTASEKAENTLLSYNTYNQQLEIYSTPESKPLRKDPTDVDSFRFLASSTTSYKEDLLFTRATIFDPSAKKIFLQTVISGKNYHLYKSYRAIMNYVSTNYVQSELRQFDLDYEYYYTSATKPGLKKLKLNQNTIKAEFKDDMDVSSYLNESKLYNNPEKALINMFTALNSK